MSKYRNRVTYVDGLRFDSLKEALRYRDLLLLERAGQISQLRRQVTFPLVVNGVKICAYRADMVYVEDGRQVVEDVKGVWTDVYRLKAKLMQAVHGITVKET